MKLVNTLEKGFRFILRKVLSSLFFRVLGLLSGLAFSWLVAKKFGTFSLGLLSINLAVAYIIIVFLKLGIDTHIVSEVSKLRVDNRSAEIGAYFRKTLALYVIMSAIGSLTIYFMSGFLGNILNIAPDKNYLSTTGLFIFPLMLTHLNAAFMRAYKKVMAFSFFLNGGVSFLSFICLLPLLNQHDTVYIPLYVQLGSIGLLSVISTIMVLRFVNPFMKGKCPYSYLSIITESLPMMVTLAVHPLWNWGGVFILGLFAPINVVGVFQILIKCSNLIGLPIRAISTIMAPIISEESSKEKSSHVKAAIIKTSSLSLILSLPVILGTIIFSGAIMSFFGQEFIPFQAFLIVLCLAKFINACYGPMSIILLMSGNQSLQGKLSLIDLSFYLILATTLTFYWGLEGAVAAMFFSLLFRNLLIGSQVKRIFGIYPLAMLHVSGFIKLSLKKRSV